MSSVIYRQLAAFLCSSLCPRNGLWCCVGLDGSRSETATGEYLDEQRGECMHKLLAALTQQSSPALVGIGADGEPIWIDSHAGCQLTPMNAGERELFWALQRTGKLVAQETSSSADDSKPRVFYRLGVEYSVDFAAVIDAALAIADAGYALRWYDEARVPSLGDQTPETLVANGQARLVIEHLHQVAQGGYA